MATFLRCRIVEMPELRGRPRLSPEKIQSNKEECAKRAAKKLEQKLERVAVLDFETDPFNNKKPDDKIYPFAACLYSDQFEPVVIWNSNFATFIIELLLALEKLDGDYVIYAHNGGKFDFMFLVKHLIGKISFKGRGIMSAKIGRHELRDSFHIIPEKLANYKKDVFDYESLTKKNREKKKNEIIRYMINDCIYLFDIVRSFLAEFGFKISIGQAAWAEIKKDYKIKSIGINTDDILRQYFYGGRVECLAGRGHFKGKRKYKLIDLNSAYPAVMAYEKHPIGNHYEWRRNGGIKENTCFIDLTCRNHGALVSRTGAGETSAIIPYGRFKTTIWEFRTAVELKLIEDIKIHQYVDCDEFSTFEKFVIPRYDKRQGVKARLDELDLAKITSGLEFDNLTKESIFIKLLLNNGFGKSAQNPRNYKESFITEPGSPAPAGYEESFMPVHRCNEFDIWEKPTKHLRFFNVGMGASITGAQRAVLMRAIHNSIGAVYCDTDSLICLDIEKTELHPTKLGAWKLEKEFDEVIVAGKKLYAWRKYANGLSAGQNDIIKVKSKGAPGGALDWQKMLNLLNGEIETVISKGPTLTKTGKQFYMRRNIRATAPIIVKEKTQNGRTTNAISL